MQNILAKIGAFFEAHVEKIVLVIAGVVGLWLLMAFVVMSSNSVTYDNMTFSPGSIDAHIYEKKARLVQAELGLSSTDSNEPYQSILDGFIDINGVNGSLLEGFKSSLPNGFQGLFTCSIGQIDSSVIPVVPVPTAIVKSDGRQYTLPYVGSVTQVQAEHIRAAAYLPSEPVTDQTDYQSVNHDINDVDLVTVQARFDVASLRARFYESFAGGGLPKEWRDETMAKPVFAAVNLQRQTLLPGGTWSPWEDVRQIGTLPQTETYSVIEAASDLPAGGIRVRMIRLKEEVVRTNILQPPAYEMASTYEEWLPPEFHGKYQVERQKEAAKKRRDERESERSNSRDTSNARGRSRGGQNTQQGMGRSAGGMGNEMGGRRGRRGASTGGNDRNSMLGRGQTGNERGGRRGARGNARGGVDELYGAMTGGRNGLLAEASPLEKVFEAFEEIRLSPMKEFSRLDETVFWAHDDSTEPGMQYRYRIRLGVLSPVAGLGHVAQQDIAYKDQVILWSDFSAVTGQVDVPKRLYFFANTYQEVSNSVSVEVAKFENGYWRSSMFSVKPGETIGRLVEIEPDKDEETLVGSRQMMRGMLEPEPEMVDFSTHVIFVAAERVIRWVGSKDLRPQKSSFDMYCSIDGMDIEKFAIGSKNWPESLSTAYGTVKRFQKEPIEDYRGFGSSRSSVGNSALGGRGQMGMGRDAYGY